MQYSDQFYRFKTIPLNSADFPLKKKKKRENKVCRFLDLSITFSYLSYDCQSMPERERHLRVIFCLNEAEAHQSLCRRKLLMVSGSGRDEISDKRCLHMTFRISIRHTCVNFLGRPVGESGVSDVISNSKPV